MVSNGDLTFAKKLNKNGENLVFKSVRSKNQFEQYKPQTQKLMICIFITVKCKEITTQRVVVWMKAVFSNQKSKIKMVF